MTSTIRWSWCSRPYSSTTRTAIQWAPTPRSVGSRAVQICDDGSALTQGFFVASLRAKTSSTNGSDRVIRSIFIGIALADAIFDGCAGTAIEEIYDKVRRKCSILCDGRAEQRAHAEFAVELLAIAMEIRVKDDPHLPRIRLVCWLEMGRITLSVDRKNMIAVRAAVPAVGHGYAAMIVRTAPPRT